MAFIKEINELMYFDTFKDVVDYYIVNEEEKRGMYDLDDVTDYLYSEVGKVVEFVILDSCEVEVLGSGDDKLDGGIHFDTFKRALEYMKKQIGETLRCREDCCRENKDCIDYACDEDCITYAQINHLDINTFDEHTGSERVCSASQINGFRIIFDCGYFNEEKALEYYKSKWDCE